MTSPNRPILITGCQRSGTTLLHLVLDSHPEIHGVDEGDFDPQRMAAYLRDPAFHPNVSLKLPQLAPDLAFLEATRGLRTLWCLRDPRDVVASMLGLELPLTPRLAVPWCVHPKGGPAEIRNALGALGVDARAALSPALERFAAIIAQPPASRGRQDRVFSAALCWRVKNELLAVYAQRGIDHHVVRYEELVARPEPTARVLLDVLKLPWNDSVLGHHRLHQGVLTGGTDAARAIDASRVGRWRDALSEAERALVEEVSSPIAEDLGY